MSVTAPPLPDGAVLLRLPAAGRSWPETLPAVPSGDTVTVTVGRADLLPEGHAAADRGYVVVGAASDTRPLGDVVDLLILPELQQRAPAWWGELLGRANRAFDLRLGPVQHVLGAELAMHARALAR
ncbi:MAG: hypothetical protein ACNA8R_01500 [Nitriliruptoraceae bacterium]